MPAAESTTSQRADHRSDRLSSEERGDNIARSFRRRGLDSVVRPLVRQNAAFGALTSVYPLL